MAPPFYNKLSFINNDSTIFNKKKVVLGENDDI